MTTIINANTSAGLTQTADTSGIVKLQSNGVTTNALAWVDYNGSAGTIRSAYNVGSVTKNGTGDYTLNFTSAMTDANYSAVTTWGNGSTRDWNGFSSLGAPATTTLRLFQSTNAGAAADVAYLNVAIFGN